MDGSDGLDFYRIIAKDGENFLNGDGYIFLEIGYKQKSDVIKIFEKPKTLMVVNVFGLIILYKNYFRGSEMKK